MNVLNVQMDIIYHKMIRMNKFVKKDQFLHQIVQNMKMIQKKNVNNVYQDMKLQI